jgi:hypothetical protein
MEAVYWGNTSAPKMSKGSGYGPWVMADLENGVWAGMVAITAMITMVVIPHCISFILHSLILHSLILHSLILH